MIVGFPQESEEEFEASRAMIESVDFYETHIFKYSRREGTRADQMEGQIPEQVKVARSHILIDLGRQQKQKFMEYYLGRNVEILFEEQAEIHGKTYWIGHTREYLKVAADTKENLENCIKIGKIGGFVEDGVFICAI